MLSFALIIFGGALFYNQEHNPIPQPQIASAIDTVAAGNETMCTFTPDLSTAPRCRVEGDWPEYPRHELFCFCPGTVTLALDGSQSHVEVFLGPEKNMELMETTAQQNWCNTELATETDGWKNVIIFEAVGSLSWSCNIVITAEGEPCALNNNQLYSDLEGNAHCISDMMQNTRSHYDCQQTIISYTAVPCVRNPDGRILVGTKEQLQAQLEGHQDHYDTQEIIMSSIAGGMFFSGLVILVITLLCCAGQIMWGSKEEPRRYQRAGETWSQDYSEDLSE